MKEYTEPGIYELRGSVAGGANVWNSSNFAGFFYDLDADLGSEFFTISAINSRTIAEDDLTYTTTIQQTEYAADFADEDSSICIESYPVIGLFGEKFVSLSDTVPDELVTLLLDNDDKYTLKADWVLELPRGYELTAKQINVDDNEVRMELSKDGEFIDDEVMKIENGAATWTLEKDVGDNDDVPVFRVLVTQVFQGQVDSLAVVEGLYLVDYQDVLEIDTYDEFGELEVTSRDGSTIKMNNTGAITLSKGNTIDIAECMGFKVADDDILRFYPFVEKNVEVDSTYLKIESYSPLTSITSDESSSQLFEFSVNQDADFTWFLDGVNVQENSSLKDASYYSSAPSFGEHTVKVVASNGYYNVTKEWKWIIQKASLVVDTLEVRSPVHTGPFLVTPAEFAGFWYDIDEDIGSEEMELTEIDARTIPKGAIRYSTAIQQMEYAADFAEEDSAIYNESYPVIGFFGDEYVSASDTDADELVKLLLDSDDKYTLRTNSALELSKGYELTAKQIDVESNKVWLELSRDGEFIDDQVIDISADPVTWTYETDIGNKDDVIVFRTLIMDIFQGQVDSLVVIEGLYLLDYQNVLSIETGDDFGELEVTSISGGSINMNSTDAITLGRDDTADIAEDLKFKVADSDTLRLYLAKEYTEPGTYEIRGSLATSAAVWTPSNFAGFFYDLDGDIGSEELSIREVYGRTIAENDLTYLTSIQQVDYKADFTDEKTTVNNRTYPVIGLFGENYVSLSDYTTWKLSKLLLDNDINGKLRTGSALELPNGYELIAKQIDVETQKVWLELSKDDELIDDEVIDSGAGETTWTCEADAGDINSVIIFRVLVNEISQDDTGSYIEYSGLWLIDHESVLTIETCDVFGEFEVVSIYDGNIVMGSTHTILLSKGSIIEIAPGLMFRVADSDSLIYYPFIEYTIQESETNSSPGSDGSDSESDATDASSSGSGGGGGGGATGEKYEKIQVKEVQSIFVNKDSHIIYEFKKEGNAISSIQFDSLKNSGTISAIIEVLKGSSSFADTEAPGKIYQQMNIWVGKAGFVTSENVEDLKIGFKVKRSWLEDNSIEADTVKLYRYANDTWNVLETSVIGEDDEHVYFESMTPGFSPFAISSETEAVEVVDEAFLQSVNEEDTGEYVDAEQSESGTTSNLGSTGVLTILSMLSFVLAAVSLLYRKQS